MSAQALHTVPLAGAYGGAGEHLRGRWRALRVTLEPLEKRARKQTPETGPVSGAQTSESHFAGRGASRLRGKRWERLAWLSWTGSTYLCRQC